MKVKEAQRELIAHIVSLVQSVERVFGAQAF
jgi:hypothetical protein